MQLLRQLEMDKSLLTNNKMIEMRGQRWRLPK
jgi:hypothetical protein